MKKVKQFMLLTALTLLLVAVYLPIVLIKADEGEAYIEEYAAAGTVEEDENNE